MPVVEGDPVGRRCSSRDRDGRRRGCCAAASISASLIVGPRKTVGQTSASITPDDALALDLGEHLVDGPAGSECFEPVHRAFHDPAREPTGLEECAVVEPHVAAADPGDRVGGTSLVEQPRAGVRGGLARADDDDAATEVAERGQAAGGDEPRALRDVERRRGALGGRRAGVGGVHDRPARAYVVLPAVLERTDPARLPRCSERAEEPRPSPTTSSRSRITLA